MSQSDYALQVSSMSKCYRIGVQDELNDTFGAAFMSFLKSPLRNYRKYRSLYRFDDVQQNPMAEQSDVLWALRDVSFEVKQGEVIGIIGRNGAGKSTLLKILSKITPPTAGSALMRGRVSSLLEVGTGFHQELTGRENVYLNGTVLGMTKREIDKKFDEIVDFSGVERFIDTPIKRYSSGMKVRLAFAVAAHLEPEILLVDEVLAVGDVDFQKKCLAKMDEVGKHGRTIIFISHSMPAITRLCPRVILLENGRISADGPSHEVVNAYLTPGTGTAAAREWPDPSSAPCGDAVRLRAVRVLSEDGKITETVDIRRPLAVEMEYEVLTPDHMILPHFHFFNENGIHVFTSIDQDRYWQNRPRPPGVYTSTVVIPGNLLAEGMLFVHANMLTLAPKRLQFAVADAVGFRVIDKLDDASARGQWNGRLGGVVRPLFEWNTVVRNNGHSTRSVLLPDLHEICIAGSQKS